MLLGNKILYGGGGVLDDRFIATFTMAASETLTIPANGTNNFTIDWGDGNSETVTTTNPTHTYTSAGNYQVIIDGTMTMFNFAIVSSSRLNIISIDNLGNTGLTQLTQLCFYCSNLVSISDSGAFDANFTGTLGDQAFHSCSKLASITGLKLNTITYAYQMFIGCSLLPSNGSLELASMTDALYLFYYCYALRTIENINMLNVTNGYRMCYPYLNIPNVKDITLKSLTNGVDMFNLSTLSTEDYSNILIRTAASVPTGSPTFHGGYSKYNAAGQTARNTLTSTYGWNITDGGLE